ncbi:PTPRT-like protein, partial [Mya arenaria]
GICKFNCVDGYVGDDCSEAVKAGPPVAAIAGGVTSGVVVIIGVAVALFFFRRSKIKQNGNNTLPANITAEENKETNEGVHFNEGGLKKELMKQYSSRSSVNQPSAVTQHPYRHVVTASEIEIDLEIDDANNRSVANSSKDDQTYYNELGSSINQSNIPIGQLVKYVHGKSHEAFSADFKKFSIGLVKPYVESQKKENISKNRYKGIYPYDDSRVKVRDSGGSDYINASFIDGYKKPKEYIATLGPMSQQLGNFSLFWKMIWQQRVEKIVMVTNLIEQGSPKCEQYWPNPGTTRKYGDIKVESCSEDEYAEFTRRAFTVTMGQYQFLHTAVVYSLPFDCKQIKGENFNEYMNKHTTRSFRMKKRYLVAQTPLPETVMDFLTLAVQERCSCIVSFEADMDKQKNIGIYYPAANQEVLNKGTFQVSCSREENKIFYAERTLTIQHKGTSTYRTISHLQFTDWDEMENIPRSTTNFLSFLNVIDNVMKQQDDGPILEQFVFCHGCVSEYLRSFDVYANFSDDTGQL